MNLCRLFFTLILACFIHGTAYAQCEIVLDSNSAAQGCVPHLVQFRFINNSGKTPQKYVWDFGNGSPGSTLQNPSSIYPAAGTYPVTLTVQSTLGCSGSITKNIVVAGKSTDYITPPNICIGQTVTFQNNSSPKSHSQVEAPGLVSVNCAVNGALQAVLSLTEKLIGG